MISRPNGPPGFLAYTHLSRLFTVWIMLVIYVYIFFSYLDLLINCYIIVVRDSKQKKRDFTFWGACACLPCLSVGSEVWEDLDYLRI